MKRLYNYVHPECEAFEVSLCGVIAVSTSNPFGGNDEEEWTNETA